MFWPFIYTARGKQKLGLCYIVLASGVHIVGVSGDRNGLISLCKTSLLHATEVFSNKDCPFRIFRIFPSPHWPLLQHCLQISSMNISVQILCKVAEICYEYICLIWHWFFCFFFFSPQMIDAFMAVRLLPYMFNQYKPNQWSNSRSASAEILERFAANIIPCKSLDLNAQTSHWW